MKKEREKRGGLDYVSHFSCDKLLHFTHRKPFFSPVFCCTHYLSIHTQTHAPTHDNKFSVTRSLVQFLRSLSPPSFLPSFSSAAAATIRDCSLLLPSNVATVYSTTSAGIKLHFLSDLSATISIWAQCIAALHP